MAKRDVLVPVLAAWAMITCGAVCMILPEPWRWVALACVLGIAGWAVAQWAAARQARLSRLSRDARELVMVDPAARAWSGAAVRGQAVDVLEDAIEELGVRVRSQVKELAKKTRNLMSLIDGLDMPVFATGSGDRVVLCNRAAEELQGVTPGALNGRPVRELFTRRELLEMHDAAKGGQVRRGDVRITTESGVRTYQVSATPLPAAWGEGVFGAIMVLRDVTELAQAVVVKSDFVANASHELRTPVAALKSAIETLADAADDPAMQTKMIEVCGKHVLRLEDMVRDLLDLSRLEAPEIPLHLADVPLAELEDTLRLQFEPVCTPRRLSLDFRMDASLDGMRTDVKLLSLVLRNLIDNATKFAAEGTAIVIRGRRLDPRADLDGHWVRMEVADRGMGIPLSQQERVFERFYQVDPARTGFTSKRGTGLGLAIVKHAVKALGGRVGLDSVWGEGTTVWMEAPVEFGHARAMGSGDDDAQDGGDGYDLKPSA